MKIHKKSLLCFIKPKIKIKCIEIKIFARPWKTKIWIFPHKQLIHSTSSQVEYTRFFFKVVVLNKEYFGTLDTYLVGWVGQAGKIYQADTL